MKLPKLLLKAKEATVAAVTAGTESSVAQKGLQQLRTRLRGLKAELRKAKKLAKLAKRAAAALAKGKKKLARKAKTKSKTPTKKAAPKKKAARRKAVATAPTPPVEGRSPLVAVDAPIPPSPQA